MENSSNSNSNSNAPRRWPQGCRKRPTYAQEYMEWPRAEAISSEPLTPLYYLHSTRLTPSYMSSAIVSYRISPPHSPYLSCALCGVLYCPATHYVMMIMHCPILCPVCTSSRVWMTSCAVLRRRTWDFKKHKMRYFLSQKQHFWWLLWLPAQSPEKGMFSILRLR